MTVAELRLGTAAPDLSLTDVQSAWMAALVDGEGSIAVWRERRAGNRSGFRYKAVVEINNTNFDIITQARLLVDGWAHADATMWRKNPKHKVLYRCRVNQRAVAALLERIRPYLIIKQRQADVVLSFCRALAESPMRASQDHEVFEHLYLESKTLNKRGTE